MQILFKLTCKPNVVGLNWDYNSISKAPSFASSESMTQGVLWINLWVRVHNIMDLWIRVHVYLRITVHVYLWIRVHMDLWIRVHVYLWIRVYMDLWIRVHMDLRSGTLNIKQPKNTELNRNNTKICKRCACFDSL